MVRDFPVSDYSGEATLFFILSGNTEVSLKCWRLTNGVGACWVELDSVSFKDTDTPASSPTLTREYETWAFNYIPHILS